MFSSTGLHVQTLSALRPHGCPIFVFTENEHILSKTRILWGVKAGIVNAGKPLPMLSVQDAVNENLIEPIFIGDKAEILKCAEDLKWDISNYKIIHEPVENNTATIAAKLASEKKIRIIVKGHIHTDVLMKEVLKREYDLLGKTRLSHDILVFYPNYSMLLDSPRNLKSLPI